MMKLLVLVLCVAAVASAASFDRPEENVTLSSRGQYDLDHDLEIEVGPCNNERNGVAVKGKYAHGDLRGLVHVQGGGKHSADVEEQLKFDLKFVPGKAKGFKNNVAHHEKSWKAGGNPHVYVQFDENHAPEYLGTCKSLANGSRHKPKLSKRIANNEVNAHCEHSGSEIHLSGLTRLNGLKGKFFFLKNKHEEPRDTDDFDVDHPVDHSDDIVFPKQPAFGGVTGNPEVTSSILSGTRELSSNSLGHCQKI